MLRMKNSKDMEQTMTTSDELLQQKPAADLLAESQETITAEIPTSSVSLKVHPWRSRLYEELHNRPSPIIEGSCQVTHLTVQNGDDRSAVYQHVVDLCTRFSQPAPAENASCFYLNFGGFELRWERHLEFTNFTFISPNAPAFSAGALAFIPKDWLNAIPGDVIVAVHIAVVEQIPSEQDLQQWFEGQRWAGSAVAENRAKVWTAFKLHHDGFGRSVIHCDSLNPYQIGRLVQRMAELETYRMMALIGLPVARELNPEVSRIEAELAVLNQRISRIRNEADERLLLHDLSMLAAAIEQHRSDTNYRFSATNAYYDLVQDRLQQLKEIPLTGVQTLQEFLDRRLSPGIKTCRSTRDRLEDLSRRIHRTTSLLRTRVELSIEAQNQRSLTAMNNRSDLQLRLQQTVEGLSVVVIAYYVLSLMKLGFEAVKEIGLPINIHLAVGAALPVVLVGVYWLSHKVRKKVKKQNRKNNPDAQAPSEEKA